MYFSITQHQIRSMISNLDMAAFSRFLRADVRHLLVWSWESSNPYQTASTNTEFGFLFDEKAFPLGWCRVCLMRIWDPWDIVSTWIISCSSVCFLLDALKLVLNHQASMRPSLSTFTQSSMQILVFDLFWFPWGSQHNFQNIPQSARNKACWIIDAQRRMEKAKWQSEVWHGKFFWGKREKK